MFPVQAPNPLEHTSPARSLEGEGGMSVIATTEDFFFFKVRFPRRYDNSVENVSGEAAHLWRAAGLPGFFWCGPHGGSV